MGLVSFKLWILIIAPSFQFFSIEIMIFTIILQLKYTPPLPPKNAEAELAAQTGGGQAGGPGLRLAARGHLAGVPGGWGAGTRVIMGHMRNDTPHAC